MLTAVKIDHFLSCKNVSITDMSAFMALVGRNGAGKTNVLRAIEWAARSAYESNVNLSFESKVVMLEMKLDYACVRYHVAFEQSEEAAFIEKIQEFASNEGTWTTIIERKNSEVLLEGRQIHIGESAPCLTAIESILKENSILPRVQSILRFLRGIRYYPIDEPGLNPDHPSLIVRDDYQTWERQYLKTGELGSSLSFKLIYLSLRDKNAFNEVRTLLDHSGLGLIDSLQVLEAPADELVLYLFRIIPSKTNSRSGNMGIAQLSLGTRRILQIITSVIFDKSSVFLFEQPEDAIHHDLLRKLIAIIKTYANPTQFILASHSSVAINAFGPSDVRLVEMKDGSTQVRALTELEQKVAKEFIGDVGPFSDFLQSIEEN